jgi:hypothetical protein
MSLSEQDREALCICAEAASEERNETETIGLCNAHRVAVEVIIARHVREALTAAAEAIESRRAAYIECGGAPNLVPSTPDEADRTGHLDGLLAAARIVRSHIPDPRERP